MDLNGIVVLRIAHWDWKGPNKAGYGSKRFRKNFQEFQELIRAKENFKTGSKEAKRARSGVKWALLTLTVLKRHQKCHKTQKLGFERSVINSKISSGNHFYVDKTVSKKWYQISNVAILKTKCHILSIHQAILLSFVMLVSLFCDLNRYFLFQSH